MNRVMTRVATVTAGLGLMLGTMAAIPVQAMGAEAQDSTPALEITVVANDEDATSAEAFQWAIDHASDYGLTDGQVADLTYAVDILTGKAADIPSEQWGILAGSLTNDASDYQELLQATENAADSDSAASLSALENALSEIQNQAANGVSERNVSSALMAVAELNANYAGAASDGDAEASDAADLLASGDDSHDVMGFATDGNGVSDVVFGSSEDLGVEGVSVDVMKQIVDDYRASVALSAAVSQASSAQADAYASQTGTTTADSSLHLSYVRTDDASGVLVVSDDSGAIQGIVDKDGNIVTPETAEADTTTTSDESAASAAAESSAISSADSSDETDVSEIRVLAATNNGQASTASVASTVRSSDMFIWVVQNRAKYSLTDAQVADFEYGARLLSGDNSAVSGGARITNSKARVAYSELYSVANTASLTSANAARLDNVEKALERINEYNQIRTENGLPTSGISATLMAAGELTSNYLKATVDPTTWEGFDHPETFITYENIAAGWPDPFVGWYDEELERYEQDQANGISVSADWENVGHYLNIVRNGDGGMYTGYGVAGSFDSQEFSSGSSMSKYFKISGVSTDQFSQMLNDYLASLMSDTVQVASATPNGSTATGTAATSTVTVEREKIDGVSLHFSSLENVDTTDAVNSLVISGDSTHFSGLSNATMPYELTADDLVAEESTDEEQAAEESETTEEQAAEEQAAEESETTDEQVAAEQTAEENETTVAESAADVETSEIVEDTEAAETLEAEADEPAATETTEATEATEATESADSSAEETEPEAAETAAAEETLETADAAETAADASVEEAAADVAVESTSVEAAPAEEVAPAAEETVVVEEASVEASAPVEAAPAVEEQTVLA